LKTTRTTCRLPGDGAQNNNQAIGPFCCTGETLTIRRRDGKAAGYVYFYGWKGQTYTVGGNRSFAPDIEILVSGLADPTNPSSEQEKSSVYFVACDMVPGASRSATAGSYLSE